VSERCLETTNPGRTHPRHVEELFGELGDLFELANLLATVLNDGQVALATLFEDALPRLCGSSVLLYLFDKRTATTHVTDAVGPAVEGLASVAVRRIEEDTKGEQEKVPVSAISESAPSAYGTALTRRCRRGIPRR
jgi:hypothetical protein